jgi:hypothetical protein
MLSGLEGARAAESPYGGVIASTHGKAQAPNESATNQACSTVSSTALAPTGLHAPHFAPSAASRALIEMVCVSWVLAIGR